MSVLDYSSTPGNNSSLASLSLAEGGTRVRDVNDMLRQLMADVKAGLMVRADNAAAVNAWNFASSDLIPKSIGVDQLGVFYYDSADTTTADNGTTVLVTASGQRYKIFPSSTPESIEEDAPTKFADSDTTPSVSGRKTWRFADAPGNITAFDGMANGEEKIIHAQTTQTSFYIENSASLVCPGNSNYIVGRYDPPIRVIQQAGIQYVIPFGMPRRSEEYGYEAVTIASGTASPTRAIFTLDGEGAAADNLVTLTVSNIFKAGQRLTAIIDQLPGKAITVVHGTGNITTPNGKNYTFSAQRRFNITPASTVTVRKEIFFRVNEAGTGVELLPDGLSVFEEYNEPFGSQDEAVMFVFGQSNAQPTTVGGTTSGAKSYVKCMKTGTLTWAAYNTTADLAQNCHLTPAAMYASPFDSMASKWESNQATLSLPVLNLGCAAQGGQAISDHTNDANASRWNPDHKISRSGGGGADPSLDGYYPIRWNGNTNASAKWSLYELSQQMIRAGLNEIENNGKRPRVLGVLWVQGEEDAGYATSAAEYFVNMRRVYDGFCRAFGRKVPIYIVLMRCEAKTYRATVFEAMLSFARQEPWARLIDPFDLDNYDPLDTGGTPSNNYGVFTTDAGGSDGVHYSQTTSNNIAEKVLDYTVRNGFYGVESSRAARDATEHRKCAVAVSANGSGSNDDHTVWDEILDNGQATALKRVETFGVVRFESTSNTIVQVFDPTTGRFTFPYAGTYRIRAQIRTSEDAALATNATTGTELRIYTNATRGAGATAGTLQGVTVHTLVASGVTYNASGRTQTIMCEAIVKVAAGAEGIIVNNNYRIASSTNYEWRGSIELLAVD